MKTHTTEPLLDQVAVLSDQLRCRIVLACESQELTVSELCQVLQLPQSTVSRHLKQLSEASWLSRRREGTKSLFCLSQDNLSPEQRRVWLVLRGSVSKSPSSKSDRKRLRSVLAQRSSRSAAFFSAQAERWSDLRKELYGADSTVTSLLGLLDPEWTIGDLGCGTGELSSLVAPFVRRVIAVDSSEAMLEAARARLSQQDRAGNVEIRPGELEQLPIEDGSLDAATLVLVLHHVPDPLRVIREARRALAPRGVLVVIDTLPHDREELRQQMGHVWLGFSAAALTRQLREAGFDTVSFRPLPEDPAAKGPSLFVASARLSAQETPLHFETERLPSSEVRRNKA